jgi:MscS family membrane protein
MKNAWIFLMFLPLFSLAQQDVKEQVKVDLSNPNATIFTHLNFLQPNSYQPEIAAKTIYGLSEKKAIEKAIKIKRVLDGKGLLVDFNQVPTNPNFNDSIGYSSNYKFILFPNRMPQIYVEKIGDKWYYSAETVRSIDGIYKEVYPWYVEKLQQVIPVFGHKKMIGLEIWQLIGFAILIVLVFIGFYIMKKVAFFILKKIQYRITHTRNVVVNEVLKKLAHPISLLFAIDIIKKVFPSLEFSLQINKWIFLSLNIAATIFWIYVFLKLVQVVMKIYSEFTVKTQGKLDDQLVPVLDNFLTGLVIFLGFLKLVTLFGVNPTTVIAGASIGGLALALASQDTVRNLIGTVMIFLDKPFHIDDWIEAGEAIGTVEQVGFRSTRIRSADTSIYQIPNSKLAEITINNKGLRLYRRYNTNLGVRYDTPPALIEAFVEGVRKIIIAHPETRSESYNVEFTGFGDSALLIMVNVYFKSLEWGVEQSSKHRLHMAIVKLALELGVEFAFPSTTVQIEQFPEKKAVDLRYNIDPEKMNLGIAKVLEEFNNNLPK